MNNLYCKVNAMLFLVDILHLLFILGSWKGGGEAPSWATAVWWSVVGQGVPWFKTSDCQWKTSNIFPSQDGMYFGGEPAGGGVPVHLLQVKCHAFGWCLEIAWVSKWQACSRWYPQQLLCASGGGNDCLGWLKGCLKQVVLPMVMYFLKAGHCAVICAL